MKHRYTGFGIVAILLPSIAVAQDTNGDGVPDSRENQCTPYQNPDFNTVFSGSTTPNSWVFTGQSYLTAGIDDPENAGVLRLTPLMNGRMGGSRSQLAFDTGDGVAIDFAINLWGGTGADGMALFLYDADSDENNFYFGGMGSTFGYFNGTAGGLTGGVLAIGFDAYGDFAVTAGGTGSNPGSIHLVGDSTDTQSGPLASAFNYEIDAPNVAMRPILGEAGHHEGTLLLRPSVNDATLSMVSLYLKNAQGTSLPVFQNIEIHSPLPPQLQIGFSGSTGGQNNFHEVEFVEIGRALDLRILLDNKETVFIGEEVDFTFTLYNDGSTASCNERVLIDLPWDDLVLHEELCTPTDSNDACTLVWENGALYADLSLTGGESIDVTIATTFAGIEEQIGEDFVWGASVIDTWDGEVLLRPANADKTATFIIDQDVDGDGVLSYDEVNTLGTNPNAPDTDGDGLWDGEEVFYNTDPLNMDTDGDLLLDGTEVSDYECDPALADTDGDGLNDGQEITIHNTIPTDIDTDDDGLTDFQETDVFDTNPLVVDSDGDGLSDFDEVLTHFTNPNSVDSDGDGLTDPNELNTHGTDANKADSDADGLSDFDELNTHGTNPNDSDSDEDGLNDGMEINTYTTDANSVDTDGDGLSDADEVNTHNTDPNNADSDFDGLGDFEELNTHGTSPTNDDSDGDGLYDNEEALGSTDPMDDDSDDDGLSDGDEVYLYFTSNTNADTDEDGLSDFEEINTYGTDPNAVDTDQDGLDDFVEINTHGTSPTNDDTDSDGLSDFEELNTHGTSPTNDDTDGDGLNDSDELNTHSTNPNNTDTDEDGLSDIEELFLSLDPSNADTDGDSLTDGEEVNTYGTNPANVDTDQDSLEDGQEINTHGTDPNNNDSDGDRLYDNEELLATTDPNNPDSDGDGLSDYDELRVWETDPNNPDSDGDELNDFEEVNTYSTEPLSDDTDEDGLSDFEELNTHGTNPNYPDSDGDGFADPVELDEGTNPNDNTSFPVEETEPEKGCSSTGGSPSYWVLPFLFLNVIRRKRKK